MFNTVILAMDHHNPRECISNTRDFGAVVEDEKVSTDDLTEQIEAFEDHVQSVDIAAFNKL